MRKIIIDASIVIKWFASDNELYLDEAFDIFRFVSCGEIEVITPTFLIVETLNILVRKKKIPVRNIDGVYEKLVNSGIRFVDLTFFEIKQMAEMLKKYKISAYDGLYLALAEQEKVKLLTEDKTS